MIVKDGKIEFNEEETNTFVKLFKKGIAKRLCEKGLLTNMQLNELLKVLDK